MYLLLVEDHLVTRETIAQLLRARGYKVLEAGGVRAALEVIASAEFEVLLCDLGLPDGSGLNIMRNLRVQRPGVLGIAVSGFGTEQDLEASRQAGFIRHLIKPLGISALVRHIEEVFVTKPVKLGVSEPESLRS